MLTGLEAFSMACNIMQVISFTGEVISTFQAIRHGQSPDVSIAVTAKQMREAFEVLSQSLEQAQKPLNQDDAEMADLAAHCLSAAAALKVELDKIWDSTKGSYKAALTGTLKKMFNQRKIDELEKLLRALREVMEQRFLHRICKQNDAMLLQQDKEFGHLHAQLRHFIDAIAVGETRLAGLIRDESESVKEHLTLYGDQLRDDIADLSAYVTSEAAQTRREIALRIKETATVQASEAEHQQLLISLEYDTQNERRNQIVDSYADTFRWIFDCPKYEPDECSIRAQSSKSFLRWLHSEGSALYWISGKAGSGKSTLMKFLVDEPQTEAELGDSTILSHFVWMAGHKVQRGIHGLSCSLLRQLVQDDRGLSAYVLDKIPRARRYKFFCDWSVQDLEVALLFALAESIKPVCVFLDGLDEVTHEEQGRTLDLVDKMCSRVPRLRVCVSSRPEPIFQTRLRDVPALRLQDLTREDIKQYIAGTLGSAFDAGDPEFRDLVQKICNKSDGVFLWVSLAIKSLQRGNRDENTLEELEKRLETLPKDLHQLYESMWHRLNDDEPIYREDGAQFLNYALGYEDVGVGLNPSLLVCTIDQLTLARDGCLRRKILEENYSPLLVEWTRYARKTARQLEIRSAGLLEITSNMWGEPSAQLIHRSAKEFLENTPSGQQILQYDKSTAEDRMSNIILATIALQHPAMIALHPEVVQHGHFMQQISLSEILEGIRRLSQHSRLSSAKVFEVMRHAKAFFQTGLWVSMHRLSLLHLITPLLPQRDPYTLPRAKPNGLPAPLRPDLDFLAIAVREGFLDFVAPTLDELEKSSATRPLHAAYKGHLVITACEGASYQLIGHRIAMAEYLLRKWSNTGLGHWGFYFPETIDQDYTHRWTDWSFTSPEIVDQDFMQPCTPIMAVCHLAFAAPRLCWVWESLECMLRNGEGGTLDDLTTVMFVERPQPKSMKGAGPHSPGSPGDAAASDNWSVELHALNTNQRIPPGKRYLLLEANMSYVFGLHQKLQGRISDTTAQEACNLAAAEIARHKVTKTAKVWLVGDGDSDPPNFYRPVSDAESSYLLEPFLNINVGRCLSSVCIPGLGHRVREVAKRGILYPPHELRRDLEDRRLIVVEENVKDWPPEQYGCGLS